MAVGLIGEVLGRMAVEVPRALDRFARVSPAGLARDLIRARRLARHEVTPRAVPRRRERVVVSLTTLPERLPFLLPTLHSLLDQTEPADRIVLCLPVLSRRCGRPFPDPLPRLPCGIDVLRCEDHGPATKLIPTLAEEPSAHIVVVDDDVIYPADMVAGLMAAARSDPGSAFGLRGWRVAPGRDPRTFRHVFGTALAAPARVDILLGTWGYLIPPGALDGAVAAFDGWPDAVRWADDVWISGHLARRGVARLVAPVRGLPLETRASRLAALTDGPNRDGTNDRIAIASFAGAWQAGAPG